MNFAKVLTGGVAAWLEFERACDRSGLFSEKYLTSAVGQILAARTGNRVEAEFTHPVLAPLKQGPGRRPQIDFVVRDESGKIVLAVESKWAGETVPNFVRDAFSYVIGKRSSNMMASWLLTACHSRTARFHSVDVAFSAR